MMNQPNKRQVTIEDLLQLKRAERPAPEFWSKFERELRAKQLAAIVEKRPWWRTFSWANIARYRISLGATAVLALSLISVRQYSFSPAPAGPVRLPVDESQPALASSAPLAIDSEILGATSPLVLSAGKAADVPDRLIALAVSNVEVPRNLVAATAPSLQSNDLGGSPSGLISWLVASDTPREMDLSPAAKSIADNLAAAKEADPELANRYLGAKRGFETRALPARSKIDPLAQMRSPSNLNTQRLLASAASVRDSGGTGAQIASRIKDERTIHEAISRFGARGDAVLFKF